MSGYFIETGALSELTGKARIVTIKVNISEGGELHHHDPSSGSGDTEVRRDRQTDPSVGTSPLSQHNLPRRSVNSYSFFTWSIQVH